ncbi:expressed unknown protein [Seminavis robusta]|uniref:Uncharacterized protein n=1 Tax=Seminavis robusta TaxID=568900 RepID=A0A9N8H3U3_9STRA|nr:expressed unknown protein [Seminavis robusta]|eukprot:Sro33_g021700.1 n/a (368) ;mRNA; r:142826-143929
MDHTKKSCVDAMEGSPSASDWRLSEFRTVAVSRFINSKETTAVFGPGRGSIHVSSLDYEYTYEDDTLSTTSLSSTCSDSSLTSSTSSTVITSREEELENAFNAFSVRLDDSTGNILFCVKLPAAFPVQDLTVDVQNGVLRVRAEIPSSLSSEQEHVSDVHYEDQDSISDISDVDGIFTFSTGGPGACTFYTDPEDPFVTEQSFQLNEQCVHIDQITAELDPQDQLTITVPLKAGLSGTHHHQQSIDIHHQEPSSLLESDDDRAFQVVLDVSNIQDLHVSYASWEIQVSGVRRTGTCTSMQSEEDPAFKCSIPIDTRTHDIEHLNSFLHQGHLTIIAPVNESGGSRIIGIGIQQIIERDKCSSRTCSV